jgi:hypothetical protein
MKLYMFQLLVIQTDKMKDDDTEKIKKIKKT